MCRALVIICCLALGSLSALGQTNSVPPVFSFTVFPDPHVRRQSKLWEKNLAVVRDRRLIQTRAFLPPELLLVVGDMHPAEACHKLFRRVFTNKLTRPLFLPVIGNHDCREMGFQFRYTRDELIPSIPSVVYKHVRSCDYYLDYKNMRMIVVDAYTELGTDGIINVLGRKWVEETIVSSPPTVEHIFVAFHEPAFPRYKHLGSSFDANPEERDAFWRMIVRHQERVRAVFVGHTHRYSRMRVRDPSGAVVQDTQSFPDEAAGVYQVTAGAAGDGFTPSFVQVQIEGRRIYYSVMQASSQPGAPYEEVDRWSMEE